MGVVRVASPRVIPARESIWQRSASSSRSGAGRAPHRAGTARPHPPPHGRPCDGCAGSRERRTHHTGSVTLRAYTLPSLHRRIVGGSRPTRTAASTNRRRSSETFGSVWRNGAVARSRRRVRLHTVEFRQRNIWQGCSRERSSAASVTAQPSGRPRAAADVLRPPDVPVVLSEKERS